MMHRVVQRPDTPAAPVFAARPPRIVPPPAPPTPTTIDEPSYLTPEQDIAQIRAMLADHNARLMVVEMVPPMTGWRGYFFGALTSRRFQLAVASALTAVASWLGGAVDATAMLIALAGIVVTYLTAETVTDVARAKAGR